MIKVPALVFRSTKGSDLTPSEADGNIRTLRDYANGLSARFGVAFNEDGSLKDDSVLTDMIGDRQVTQSKLDWTANFYAVATGTDTYAASFSPSTPTFGYGDGATDSFLCVIKFTNANTAAASLDVNGVGAKTIKKFATDDLVAGDIPAGGIFLLAYDGTNFQLLGELGNSVQRGEFKVLQVQSKSVVTNDTTNVVIPFDATIPQSGEGKEFTTFSFTPVSASSKLFLEFDAPCALTAGGSGAPYLTVALFKDADSNALAVGTSMVNGDHLRAAPVTVTGRIDSPGTTPVTFKVRFGPSSGSYTMGINYTTVASAFGGVMQATLKITEYLP